MIMLQLPLCLLAQNESELAGDEAFSLGFYKEAITHYKAAIVMSSQNSELISKMAESARLANDYPAAIRYYQRLRNTANAASYPDADYQLATDDGRRTELEAIYCIRTDDGTNIHVRNRGIVVSGNAANGAPCNYFMAAPVFEAPGDSRYAWLNDAIYVCAPEFVEGFPGIVLNVWRVTAP